MVRTIGLIPARGGSKRLPGKNVRLMHDKPLICWTIEAALLSELDAVYVSTDDKLVTSICSGYMGLHVIDRPPHLADDLATSFDVVEHALNIVDCDRIMLLQPTSPLRKTRHINEAMENYHSCWSGYDDGMYAVRNGAIYLMDAESPFRFESVYLMDKDDSVDIDTIDDFFLAEKILSCRGA